MFNDETKLHQKSSPEWILTYMRNALKEFHEDFINSLTVIYPLD